MWAMQDKEIEGEEVVCPECHRVNSLGPVVSGTDMHYVREAKCACGLTLVVPFIRAMLAAEKAYRGRK